MYLTEILWLSTWPIFIFFSLILIKFLVKKYEERVG